MHVFVVSSATLAISLHVDCPTFELAPLIIDSVILVMVIAPNSRTRREKKKMGIMKEFEVRRILTIQGKLTIYYTDYIYPVY